MDLRSDETLKLIDDFEGFEIDHHQANLNRFHLIGDDYKRSWRFALSNFITSCLKVDAIEVAVWRKEVLDGFASVLMDRRPCSEIVEINRTTYVDLITQRPQRIA